MSTHHRPSSVSVDARGLSTVSTESWAGTRRGGGRAAGGEHREKDAPVYAITYLGFATGFGHRHSGRCAAKGETPDIRWSERSSSCGGRTRWGTRP